MRILSTEPILVAFVQDTGSLPAFDDVASPAFASGVPEVILQNIPEHRVIPRSTDPNQNMVIRIRNLSTQGPANIRLNILSQKLY